MKIESIENLEAIVLGFEVGVVYEWPDWCRYKWIAFHKEEDYFTKKTYYSCKAVQNRGRG